jgi:hypothetical protein
MKLNHTDRFKQTDDIAKPLTVITTDLSPGIEIFHCKHFYDFFNREAHQCYHLIISLQIM